jgi:hydroxypyruvate reductase
LVKQEHAGSPLRHRKIKILEAGHPFPDANSLAGTRQILSLLSKTTATDLVICLISGGGSALLTAPASNISLQDLQTLTRALLACGAKIDEINIVRKHLDTVKGGGLARWASPAHILTLILSDVIGDRLDSIASGPTCPDPSTYTDAWEIIQRYNLVQQTPQAILSHLKGGQKGESQETPKPGEMLFQHVHNVIVGNIGQAAEAAIAQARVEGFNTLLLTTCLQGEARQVGKVLAAIARQIVATGQPIPPPACIVAGGETTVTLHSAGKGGRNQECVLAAALEITGQKNTAIIALATDGGDGPTDAAGAVATGETINRARQLGLDPLDHLARNDSYHFFQPLDDLIKTGPTLTNVNDLLFIVVY